MSFKVVLSFLCISLIFSICSLQAQPEVPEYYQQQESFNDSLQAIIDNAGLDGRYSVGSDATETISFAVIDLNGKQPVLGGVHLQNFIYPASVYKMYVAMEILKQVSEGRYPLYKSYAIQHPNTVDTAKEIANDPRPLLADGDTVTVYYLLDLMITRSDNSAANAMIDIAERPKINETMNRNGWHGSEVTRKYVPQKYEDPEYKNMRSSETSALHAVDFMYKIYKNKLVNPWVSMQMKTLLGAQLDSTKLAAGLPDSAMFYHKTGWWSTYTLDVGIVDDGKLQYIIALFTPLRETEVAPMMKEVSSQVYELIRKRHSVNH